MHSIDLNCDMGEGFPSDALLMPYISSANIACGYHAGDLATMRRTVELCIQHNVAIGAHPSFPGRDNFGRTDMIGLGVNYEDLPELIINQVIVLQQVCREAGTTLHHVKPHGALYNRAAIDEVVSMYVCMAILSINPGLILYGLSGSSMERSARKAGLQFRCEVFADRIYENDGTLRSRSLEGSLIEEPTWAVQQVLQMINNGTVTTIDNSEIPMRAETVCIHGDGKHAVEFAETISRELKKNNILITYKRSI